MRSVKSLLIIATAMVLPRVCAGDDPKCTGVMETYSVKRLD